MKPEISTSMFTTKADTLDLVTRLASRESEKQMTTGRQHEEGLAAACAAACHCVMQTAWVRRGLEC